MPKLNSELVDKKKKNSELTPTWCEWHGQIHNIKFDVSSGIIEN